jgi:uncharacterized membrane protein
MNINEKITRRRQDINNLLNKKVIKIELGKIIVIVSIIIYTIVFSAYNIFKHWSFNSFAWDLGIYNQAFWTTANQEGIFYYTCELHLVESGSFFGVHFSPILFFLVPIYRLLPRPETLLILQSLILGAAAYPLYMIGKHCVDRKTGLLASTMYLCNPVVHGINCYDFHVQSMIPLAFFISMYYYSSRKWAPFLIATAMALMIEEHTSYVVLIYSSILIIEHIKKRKEKPLEPLFEVVFPFLTLLFSIFWYFLSREAINYFNPNISETLRASRHFEVLGVDDPQGIPSYILMNPNKVLDSLSFAPLEKLRYLMYLIGPYLHLPFASPLHLLPTTPWFTISLLSNYQPYYDIGFQYPSYVIPFVLYSFIVGLRKIKGNNHARGQLRSHERAAVMCLILSLIFSFFASPLSPLQATNEYSPAYLKPNSNIHSELIRVQLEKIPRHASVLTQDNIFPHLSSRKNAYVLPPPFGMEESDWNRSMDFILNHQPDYILIDTATDHHGVADFAFGWIEENFYTLDGNSDGVFLYRRTGLKPIPDNDLTPAHRICLHAEGVASP